MAELHTRDKYVFASQAKESVPNGFHPHSDGASHGPDVEMAISADDPRVQVCALAAVLSKVHFVELTLAPEE